MTGNDNCDVSLSFTDNGSLIVKLRVTTHSPVHLLKYLVLNTMTYHNLKIYPTLGSESSLVTLIQKNMFTAHELNSEWSSHVTGTSIIFAILITLHFNFATERQA